MIKKFKIFENLYNDIQEYRYLTLEILINGNLKISLTEEGKEEVEDSGISVYSFSDYFDDIRSNTDYIYFENMSDAGISMSESPCIINGWYYDDNDNINFYNDCIVYWYPNYMIRYFTDELVKNGYVIFTTDKPRTKKEIEKIKMDREKSKYNL